MSRAGNRRGAEGRRRMAGVVRWAAALVVATGGLGACGDGSGDDAPDASVADTLGPRDGQGSVDGPSDDAGGPAEETTGADAGGPAEETTGADADAEPRPWPCHAGVCAAGPDHAPDPSTWGPFPVGVRTYTFESTSWEGDPRTLTMEVWYPAVDGAREGPFEPIDLVAQAPPEIAARYPDLPVNPVPAQQVRDAEANLLDGPYPVVVFSHGAYGVRFQSIFWTLYLASHGYVVPAVDHAGNTTYDLVAAGGYDLVPVVLNAVERPLDVMAAADWMAAANEEAGHPFEGLIDPDRFGVSGHSFGGYTSFVVPYEDPRFKAAVPMTPFTSAVPILGHEFGAFPVPAMVLTASQDNTLDTDQEMWETWQALPAPKHYGEFLGAGHFTFSDICELQLSELADALEINTESALEDGCSPDNLSPEVAHPIIRRLGIGFLNHVLRDSPASRAYYAAEGLDAFADALDYVEQVAE